MKRYYLALLTIAFIFIIYLTIGRFCILESPRMSGIFRFFYLTDFFKTMTWKTYYLHFKSCIYLFIHVLLPRVWSFLCVNVLHASEKNVYSELLDVISENITGILHRLHHRAGHEDQADDQHR